MTAPTDYFIDPSLGSDTGDGSIGTPWGRASGSVLAYAFTQITRDATNGDRVNVKTGAYDTLTSALNFSSAYGTGSQTAPLTLQGYTSAQGDGGIGQFDHTTYEFGDASVDFVNLFDLELKNGTYGFHGDNYCVVQNCEVHGFSSGGINLDNDNTVCGCNIHSPSSANGINLNSYCHVFGNYLNGIDGSYGIQCGSRTVVERNIITQLAAGVMGIKDLGYANSISHNSILGTSGTAQGMLFNNAAVYHPTIHNNLIEGFSGAGGAGINFNSTTGYVASLAGNGYYNNTTNEENKTTGRVLIDTDNESLGASPFAKSGSDTFANRFVYFAPVDTGNVATGAYGGGGLLSKGAVQTSASGGGDLRTKRVFRIGY